MSVYVNGIQVGSVQDLLASLIPMVSMVLVVMIVISLIRSLMRG